ncbi:hypothetical protein C8Q77DRAFT_1073535 [Trametes polyzona]|nr:hypothetical protein C8Q77DRAFT_1073535 [Trametes polyzona]
MDPQTPIVTVVPPVGPDGGVSVPLASEIVRLCLANGLDRPSVLYPTTGMPRFFIKYGRGVEEQGCTQDYVYRHALQDATGSAPHVPRVYYAFRCGALGFVVMEYVPRPTVQQWLADHREDAAVIRPMIASAVDWILKLPVPGDGVVGPVGGGRIMHIFFKDQEAPFPFPDVGVLQQYVNRAIRWGATVMREPFTAVDFGTEPLQFCDSDPADWNFLFDPSSRTLWRVDYEHVCVLPASFAAYALICHHEPEIRRLALVLNVSHTANMEAMARYSREISMCSTTTFGMKPTGAKSFGQFPFGSSGRVSNGRKRPQLHPLD